MNKTIIITGGTSGIGYELYKLFIKDDNQVFVIAKNKNENITENYIECDISDAEKVKSAMNIILSKTNKIDLLINCAGYGVSGATELISLEETKKLFDVNYFGTLCLIQNCLPHMIAGSRIVNISSACALFPLPYRTEYCASKAAVSMLSLGLRMECEPFKVDVCCICPGDVKTNFTKNRVKVFETNERYGNRIKLSTDHLDSKQDKRMSVDFVAKKIYKISNAKKTKPMIIIGAKYKVLNFITRFFSKGILLKVTNKIFNKK